MEHPSDRFVRIEPQRLGDCSDEAPDKAVDVIVEAPGLKPLQGTQWNPRRAGKLFGREAAEFTLMA